MARGKSREKATILERQLLALDLRKAGLTFRAIAAKLGVNHQTAYNDVMAELKRLSALRTDSAEELRQLELEKLDKYEANLTHWAEAGSVEAVKTLLKVQERRSKLLGLDAPEKIEHKGDLMTGLVINLGDD
jgi:predicted transcriptional regulator